MKVLTLRQEILLDKLQSDLLIYRAKFLKEKNYVLNPGMVVTASATLVMIEEIERQICEITEE